MSIRVSVILPTSDRAGSVAATLKTIVPQRLPQKDFEILVVENGQRSGTEDATRKIAQDNSGIEIRYLYEPTPGLLSGRHRGAQEARGDILVFADDDVDASADWLEAISDSFADRSVHLVGGRNLPRFAHTPPTWLDGYWYMPPYGGRACTHLSLLDLGEHSLEIDANYVWGLNFSIRRTTLFELGGFHPDCIPIHLQHFQGDGETGLTMNANEANRRAIYEPSALLHHRVPASRLTVEYFRQRAFYQGVCDSFTAVRREPRSLASTPAATSEPPLEIARPSDNLSFEEVSPHVQASYDAGYRFHQDTVRKHPRLLDWVLRKDYWDYRLPDLGT